jgi:hypothetical protein
LFFQDGRPLCRSNRRATFYESNADKIKRAKIITQTVGFIRMEKRLCHECKENLVDYIGWGRPPRCGDCQEEAAQRNREWKQAYHQANLERYRDATRRFRERNPGYTTAQKREQRGRAPEKGNAQQLARYHKGRGNIVPPRFCEHQYCIKRPEEMHHTDYNKPLEVVHLCRTHHNKIHRTQPTDESSG